MPWAAKQSIEFKQAMQQLQYVLAACFGNISGVVILK
jgi:hypothetical protein